MSPSEKKNTETATFAGGCFWCTEAVFDRLKGVSKVTSGYTGGQVPDPTYKQVCEGTTGHAEAVQIVYDPKVITFDQLLDVFFHTHDPTTLNRQGADTGTQYRSSVFYHNEEQKTAAKKVIDALNAAEVLDNPIVTKLEKLGKWYPAEDYHQQYFELNGRQPYCQVVINPKIAKFRKRYKTMLKDE
ncbi:peptide-methionine (S)-S-oxide reductase MsrA [Fuerstiella marisgermanici]|uniref:Peptide methionine sulfoxide reductase MsrA n=1 Tax=Fuerstiella marisgermanici TaxID=1891926 RepID=A0A1P8WIZ7_9PLAN|nr:peptide-methionine (S)-S-oxide reductase MsrA [Fuerstiella marisgermanici]APZ94042.1 Peptide methionine sulfoxide reductase MsrA [Fuerstiella marisgermanici]